MSKRYVDIETGEVVQAMKFERLTLADLILFTDSQLTNIKCSSFKPYHKFHATLPGNIRIVEGMMIVMNETSLELSALTEEKFNQKYKEENDTGCDNT